MSELVGWRCTRCGHEMRQNFRWCPRCEYTVYRPIHDHERPDWREHPEETVSSNGNPPAGRVTQPTDH